MSDVKCRDAERELLTLAILDGTIDRPTAADLVRCIDKLECRIESLERRIEKMENDQMLTMQTSPKKMPLPVAVSYLEGMAHVARRMVEMHQAKLEETERRIEKVERKLNHKGVEQ